MKRRNWLKFVAVAMIACAATAFAAETSTPQPAPALIKANPKSKIYHKAGCRFYNAKGNTVTFKTVAGAVKAGYKPCKFCAVPKDKKEKKKTDEQGESSGDTK